MIGGINRRKFIAVSGAAAGLALVPFGTRRQSAADGLIEWRGMSLGAVATIRINHPDRAVAQRLIGDVVGEARRLEAVLSLYQDNSSSLRAEPTRRSRRASGCPIRHSGSQR